MHLGAHKCRRCSAFFKFNLDFSRIAVRLALELFVTMRFRGIDPQQPQMLDMVMVANNQGVAIDDVEYLGRLPY